MRYTAHDPDDADDPEFPDAADTDDGDGDGDPAGPDVLDPCPRCRRLVYADAERCPHCGEYVTPAADARLSRWAVVTAVVCLVALIVLLFR